jgi:hemoglobin
MATAVSIYEAAGGATFFEALVDAFYDGVAADPELVRVYPTPDDLRAARRHLSLFLSQYWGGPATYSQQRGHPRLRLRHAPFEIGQLERDRWLHHMRAAIDRLAPAAEVRTELVRYFEMAAEAMRNRE